MDTSVYGGGRHSAGSAEDLGSPPRGGQQFYGNTTVSGGLADSSEEKSFTGISVAS